MKKIKSLGQVFLRDQFYIGKIIESFDFADREVLEIGPGQGVITRYLAEKVSRLRCVEVDGRLASYLKKKFSESKNVEIINENILEVKMSGFGNRQLVFGNVPYYISNDLIRYFLENKEWIDRVYVMFQKEFAEKLCAGPGNKNYGFLSCYFQYSAKAEILFIVPKDSFSPRPKVDSAFMEIMFLPGSSYPVCDREVLFKIIRRAFSQRRKKMFNSLSGMFDKEVLSAAAESSIDLEKRADNFSLRDFCRLTDWLHNKVNL